MTTKIIFGPPGTGKTTTLMSLLEEELKKVPPIEIAYVSFTKEGANQGKDRAKKKFGFREADFVYFRTLHSLAFKELGLKRSGVMARKHYKHFSTKMGMSFTGYYTEDLVSKDDRYLFFDEIHRNNPRVAKNYLKGLDIEKLKHVRHNYKRYKETFSLVDYTDMVQMFNERNKPIPVKVAFVDEAQDLTSLQWHMVWTAFRNCERIYIAGDDDQAIYEWSGADVEYFLKLPGEITILNHSYRLPRSVLNFSKKVSAQISNRVQKPYEGSGEDGYVTQVNSIEEIGVKRTETYMFLSRNNIFLDEIEKYLMKKKIVYTRKGKPSVSQTEMDLIRMYERLRKTQRSTPAEDYALKPHLKPGYSLKEAWFDAFNWSYDKTNYIRDLVEAKISISNPMVYVGTIHSVKGGEADNVVILLDITASVKKNLDEHPDTEHRVFYVGCTRTKKRLYIVNSHTRYAYPNLIGDRNDR